MRIGSLFSGAGGLDMAVESVFSGRVVWQSEIDGAASKVLAHRFPGVTNLGDITAIGWDEVPPVDILCGGFPCQDVSAAGKRAGIKDGTRSGLWAVFADAIDALRPQWVVIENVRGLLSAAAHRTDDDAADHLEPGTATVGNGTSGPVLRAAGAVLGDLAERGYDAQWTTLAAASVGAPHRRERVFIVAADTEHVGSRREANNARGWESDIAGRGGRREPEGLGAASGGWAHAISDAPDAPRDGRHEGRPELAGFVGGSDVAVSRDGDVALLPTPNAGLGEHRRDSGQDPAKRRAKGRQVSLADVACHEIPSRDGHVELLPTPSTHDKTGARSPETIARMEKPFSNLNDTVVNDLLPTPNASDGSGVGQHPDKREGHSRQLIDYVLADKSQWGKYAAAIARWEQIAGPAPAPTEPNRNGKPRLNPAFSEWMMGWPSGWVTDPAIGISRNDQLRIVGNGVCPQQAVAALRFLVGVEVAA